MKTEKDVLNIETAYPRVLGSIFHDFYTGMERIFEKIVREVESGLLKSVDWPKDLLEDMTLEIQDLRPQVIVEEKT